MILWKCELCTTNSVHARHEIEELLHTHHIEYKLCLADRRTMVGYGSVSYHIMHDDIPNRRSLYRYYVKRKDLAQAAMLIKDVKLVDNDI